MVYELPDNFEELSYFAQKILKQQAWLEEQYAKLEIEVYDDGV